MPNSLVLNNLMDLQNKIKRDRQGYFEDFNQAHIFFKSHIDLFEVEPSQPHKQLQQLIMFMAHVTPCYLSELNHLPGLFKSLLTRHKTNMHPHLRMSFCKALAFYRNRKIVSSMFILQTFFTLCTCNDKQLRKFIKQFIKNDIKKLNKKGKDNKLNAELQQFLFDMLKLANVRISKVALNILVEMYRKHIWTDARLVNAIADCLFSSSSIILVKALTFFVRRNDVGEIENEDSDNEESDKEKKSKYEEQLKSLLHATSFTKKTKRKARKLKRTKKLIKKGAKESEVSFNLPALHVIYDAQSLVEKLLKYLMNYNGKFHIKIMMMDLISRLVGLHQLVLLNFYPYLQRYLHARQNDVTKVLLFGAQATHDQVPSDVIETLVKTICYNFVSDHNADEVIGVGLNSIREIIARHPFALNDNRDLIEDITEYRKHRNRGVVTAARSIIQLLRSANPELLKPKTRGKPSEHMQEVLEHSTQVIPGVEVLLDGSHESIERDDDENGSQADLEEDDEGPSEVDSDDENSDGGSETSDNDDGEVENSDSDSESETGTPAKQVRFNAKATATSAEELLKSRILTDEDFKKIKIENLRKKMQFANKSKLKKKLGNTKESNTEEPEIDSDDLENATSESDNELPSYEAIARVNIKRRHDKEAKMATILAGKEGREKFGRPQKRQNPHASTTNAEKSKKKNFLMMRQKNKRLKRRSFKERQSKLKNSLKRKFKK